MPRNVTRAVSLAACLAWGAACNMPVREVGRPPEGEVREKETAASRADQARKDDARRARQDAGEAGSSGDETTPEQRARIGTPATKRYHRANCAELKDVPPEGRVRFATSFSALDADFSPCARCAPGP